MIFTMAATIAACGKKTDNGTESSVTTESSSISGTEENVKEEAPANTDNTENKNETVETDVPSEPENAAPTEGESEQSEAILENEGELEIVVPEGEETFGE